MSDYRMTRRRVMSTGLAAAIPASTGCLNNPESESDAQRTLRLDASHVHGPLRDRYVVDLSDTSREWDEAALRTTLDAQSGTGTLGRSTRVYIWIRNPLNPVKIGVLNTAEAFSTVVFSVISDRWAPSLGR